MPSLLPTYQLIADILNPNSPTEVLETQLKASVDWDAVVREGSKHLVLPAIYCNLQKKNLLQLLPEDLSDYLKTIKNLNQQRNEALIKQLHSISKILIANNIDHVFLKGSALLAKSCYENNAERMIGDIDILVARSKSKVAYEIFKQQGYKSIAHSFGQDIIKNHKHLPRLLPKAPHIFALEVHEKLFNNKSIPQLESALILSNRVLKNNFYVPSAIHCLNHTILNHQINDKGARYQNFSFRTVYDVLVQIKKQNDIPKFYHLRSVRRFEALSHFFFSHMGSKDAERHKLFVKFYMLRLKYPYLNAFWFFLLNLISFVSQVTWRLYHFISTSSYRKGVLKTIRHKLFFKN